MNKSKNKHNNKQRKMTNQNEANAQKGLQNGDIEQLVNPEHNASNPNSGPKYMYGFCEVELPY